MGPNDSYKLAQRIAEVDASLTNQTPDAEQIGRIEDLRDDAKALSRRILRNTRPGREQSLAITKLEEALMWAVKAVVLEDVEL